MNFSLVFVLPLLVHCFPRGNVQTAPVQYHAIAPCSTYDKIIIANANRTRSSGSGSNSSAQVEQTPIAMNSVQLLLNSHRNTLSHTHTLVHTHTSHTHICTGTCFLTYRNMNVYLLFLLCFLRAKIIKANRFPITPRLITKMLTSIRRVFLYSTPDAVPFIAAAPVLFNSVVVVAVDINVVAVVFSSCCSAAAAAEAAVTTPVSMLPNCKWIFPSENVLV